MPPLFRTPGGVVRWIIRDMLVHQAAWHFQPISGEVVCKLPSGHTLCVDPGNFYAIYCINDQLRERYVLRPGPFRAWRLSNAVRRLAARKISEVLP